MSGVVSYRIRYFVYTLAKKNIARQEVQLFLFQINFIKKQEVREGSMCLTLCYHDSPQPVVVDHLDVAVVHIAEEDAVGAGLRLAIVESQRHYILEEGRVLQWLHGWVEVALIREVDTL